MWHICCRDVHCKQGLFIVDSKCLLAGIVLARLGAQVVLTDLEPNLPLLTANCNNNGENLILLQHQYTEQFMPPSPMLYS